MNIIGNNTVCDLEELWWNGSREVVEDVANECISTSQPNSYVIGYLVWETSPNDEWKGYVRQLYTLLNNSSRKFVLVLNTVYKATMEQYPFDVVFLDYFLLRTYYEYKVNGHEYNRKWNSNSTKFLFLTGSPERENRIRLLYKFQQVGLLSECEWSLFVTDDNIAYCSAYLPELTHDELLEFVKNYSRNADNITLVDGHYGGHPYDCGLFASTLFRVITETAFTTKIPLCMSPWVTEKTWMTILNNQPFIMAGNIGTLEYLSKKGFRTFERYMKCPEYDLIEDDEQRMDAIIENTMHFLKQIDVESIADDVRYNHTHFMKLVDDNLTTMRELLMMIGHETHDPFDVIPLQFQYE